MAKKKSTIRKFPKVYEIKISLLNTEPLVWRKILAHEFVELQDLHMLIQMSMGWEANHMYSFDINGKSYTDAISSLEMKSHNSEGVELSKVLGTSKTFKYTYDFGDNWVHSIEIANELEHDPRMQYPICIAGENACPPEDCGGPYGFQELKSTLAGKDSKNKDELLTWLGGFYNPSTFDPNFVNKNFLWEAEDDFDF